MRSANRASYFFSANHAPGPISAAPTSTASTIKLQSGGRHPAARTSSRRGRGAVGEAVVGTRDGAAVVGSSVGPGEMAAPAKVVETALALARLSSERVTAMASAAVGAAVVGEGDGSGVGSIEGGNVTVGPGLGARDGGTVGTLEGGGVGTALGGELGTRDGTLEGGGVGGSVVGSPVGAAVVGSPVGAAVGSDVGSDVVG